MFAALKQFIECCDNKGKLLPDALLKNVLANVLEQYYEYLDKECMVIVYGSYDADTAVGVLLYRPDLQTLPIEANDMLVSKIISLLFHHIRCLEPQICDFIDISPHCAVIPCNEYKRVFDKVFTTSNTNFYHPVVVLKGLCLAYLDCLTCGVSDQNAVGVSTRQIKALLKKLTTAKISLKKEDNAILFSIH